MGLNTLEYALKNGYLQNWLIMGPFVREIAGSDEKDHLSSLQQQIAAMIPQSQEVADRAQAKVGEKEGKWVYFRCREDHLVTVFHTFHQPEYAYAWAFTHLESPQPAAATLEVHCEGPVTVWWNGEQILAYTGSLACVQSIPVQIEESNDVYVCLGWAGEGKQARSFAAHMGGDVSAEALDAMRVRLATPTKYPNRHQTLEEEFEKAYLDETVSYHGNKASLRWAEHATPDLRYAFQIQDDLERIYVEGSSEIKVDEAIDVGHPFRIFEYPYRVVLRAPAREYYDMGLRYQREIPLYIIDNAYSNEAYASYPARRMAALEDASRRRDDLFAEIAKMSLGKWQSVEWLVIEAACANVRAGGLESGLQRVGLLGILYRYSDGELLPADRKEQVGQAVCDSRYTPMADESESRAALQLAGMVLAGQMFGDRRFAPGERTGQEMKDEATVALAALLRKKGAEGFAEWGSDLAYERWVVVLSHLAGLVEDETLGELSAVLLDKLLFLMACDHFQGMLALPASETSVYALRSGQLQATAGLQRQLWGMGVFHRRTAGIVSFSCSEYEFPSFFADIAGKQAAETLVRERHVTEAGPANLVLYKTPDYALSSVQNYRPGQPGKAERVWQAWMGTEAVVYTSHPANAYDDEYHQPGFWLGNQTMPKVAQHDNTLIAIYHAPQDDRMGFTHAYFPLSEMDEHRFEGQWAFGRKGDAYVALAAQHGFELIKQGPGAFRELRSQGSQNVWVCMLGNKAEFEDFRGFQKKVMKGEMEWGDLRVALSTPRGDHLRFGWDAPLTVNDEAVPSDWGLHIENAYCRAEQGASTLDVQYEGVVLRMIFE